MSLERIDIEGTFNFRDIGGAPVPAVGASVTTGRVFRADGLAHLTDRSRAAVRDLGIRTVVDLRDIGERSTLPDALDGLGVRHIELPIFSDRFFPLVRPTPEEIITAAAGAGIDPGDRSLDAIYALMVSHFGPRLALAVDTVAEAAETGVVFHCSAGKDRTGMVGAFILDLLGVRRTDIIAEYAITQKHLAGDFLEAITRNFADAGIAGDLESTATAAPPVLMESTLDSIAADYGEGGVEAYLLDHGMDPTTPERLRSALLSPTD